jgi:alpha-beta hydrolase superfamily lysophospholipase
MKEIDDYFIFKKYNIYYKILKNENKSKDGILFLHGKGSHTGYFKNIIETNKNINFYSFDLPGFGKSSGIRGHIKSFKIYIDLINFFVKEYIEKDNIQKLFIVGESMGSLLAYYFYNNFEYTHQIYTLFIKYFLSCFKFKREKVYRYLYIK